MSILARFLVLCTALLALPVIASAQTIPPPPPPVPTPVPTPTPPPLPRGWYSNGSSEPFYKDSDGLSVEWENSYLYQYPKNDPLYWYAQVVYRNTGSKTLTIWCTDPDSTRHDDSPLLTPGAAKEHIRGNAGYMGYVGADETHCSRTPYITVTLKPGDTFYGWAIFHNVPWGRQGETGEVSLEWGNKGSSAWVDPWDSAYSPDLPPPAVCPTELVTLGTCQLLTSIDDPSSIYGEKFGETRDASGLHHYVSFRIDPPRMGTWRVEGPLPSWFPGGTNSDPWPQTSPDYVLAGFHWPDPPFPGPSCCLKPSYYRLYEK
jgi:hypothetical protein